jgi:hypothetical protein
MLSRYKRLVPRSHRTLIYHQGLPRPDWFVGAAEQPLDPRDPALQAQIADVERRIEQRSKRIEQPAAATTVQPDETKAEPDRAGTIGSP